MGRPPVCEAVSGCWLREGGRWVGEGVHGYARPLCMLRVGLQCVRVLRCIFYGAKRGVVLVDF